MAMVKKFPVNPANPHRLCWGCDKYCPADSMACGNGSDRTQHPVELFGEDWMTWGQDTLAPAEVTAETGVQNTDAAPATTSSNILKSTTWRTIRK